MVEKSEETQIDQNKKELNTFLIYSLIYSDDKSEHASEVEIIELVETDFSLEFVKNYAKENYQDEYELVYVEEVQQKTVITSP